LELIIIEQLLGINIGYCVIMNPSDSYPTRAPVEWHTIGEIGPHPQIEGITGKQVIIMIEKQTKGFEGMVSKLFNAPRKLKRPLDDLNSLFWELMDGSRDLKTIVQIMDSTFHERIAPVSDRLSASLVNFLKLNLIVLLESEFDNSWDVDSVDD